VAGLAVGLLLSGCAFVWWGVQPPRPGRFYTAPAEVGARPGVLLRAESVDSDVERATSYRILYTSRDLHNRPVAVSGLVLVPHAPAPSGGYPVIGWAHGTTGVARRCAPSLTPDTVTTTVAGAQKLVDAGYLVAATDYPGLGTSGTHPYLIGRSEAQAVLDSVQAVRDRPDWHAGARFVLWGHSQGGHAALFASQYAARLAPGLQLAGTAVAAPATELSVLLRQDLTEPFGKVFGSMALTSWSRLFPGADLARAVKRRDRPLTAIIAAGCIAARSQALVALPPVKLMSQDFVSMDLTTTQPWASIITDNTVAPEGIDGPLFIAQGTADRVIGPEVSREWARRMCRRNPMVTYHEYAGKDHLSVLSAAESDVLAWMEQRFTGSSPEPGCRDIG
jgi:alpha-beta hydrolase superfamily lysophospholipase